LRLSSRESIVVGQNWQNDVRVVGTLIWGPPEATKPADPAIAQFREHLLWLCGGARSSISQSTMGLVSQVKI
jgi:hypothetical protein